jgi:hypothetical protein
MQRFKVKVRFCLSNNKLKNICICSASNINFLVWRVLTVSCQFNKFVVRSPKMKNKQNFQAVRNLSVKQEKEKIVSKKSEKRYNISVNLNQWLQRWNKRINADFSRCWRVWDGLGRSVPLCWKTKMFLSFNEHSLAWEYDTLIAYHRIYVTSA